MNFIFNTSNQTWLIANGAVHGKKIDIYSAICHFHIFMKTDSFPKGDLSSAIDQIYDLTRIKTMFVCHLVSH